MKRAVISLILIAAAYAFAQEAPPTRVVPVTALQYDIRVIWPAPTVRVLGPGCDETATALLNTARTLEPRLPEEVKEYACYTIQTTSPDQYASYVHFIASYTRTSAGYTLSLERPTESGELLQVWQSAEGPDLLYVYRFKEKAIELVAARVELE
ncbi:hypothetical protein [Marinithermus hydrothermalis]|uniref:Uncharacterized protein n=1 Tax=Marinithermus hydrothermalis (strain DSM 14884 / JCM 11576 / T1) TaxID=869210 RepID=F2NK50_MARHT|nr:hypothetical protein [Marinithermus hydrothermalis]AEB12021.1 hypothetical protein Marky_1281 [Marinithermus hydrothermalis DSM 14884]